MKNLFENTEWQNVPIDATNMNVDMHRLASNEAGAASLLVRFPAGWRRDEIGHYLCDEEFIVIKGALHISDHVLTPGTYGFIPALVQRYASATYEETWAVAWFGARPTWVREDVKSQSAHENTLLVELARHSGILRNATEIMPVLAKGADLALGTHCEVLDLDNATWRIDLPGAATINRGLWQ